MNSLSGKFFCFVSCFLRFSLALPIQTDPSCLLLLLTFVPVKLGETVTYCSLGKGYPCVGATLHSLHAPSDLGRAARSDMNTSHIFLQGLLAAITWLEGGCRERGWDRSHQGGGRTLVRDFGVSVCPLCPVLGASKLVCSPHRWRPGFPQPTC